MSKIISYLCIFNMLIFSCFLTAVKNGGNNGRNNKRPSIPEKWQSRPVPGVSSPKQPSGQPMHKARAKPARPRLSKRRFLDPMEDQPQIKTRTFRYKNLEPADWETAQRYFVPATHGEDSTSTEPVRRFFMQQITDFMRSPYGIIVVATTIVTTASITAVMIWPYLQSKSAQLYKKIVNC
ncbi:hypothetical protein E3J79_02455 [Candidatus Dependentiae bacterium]|nr:MAG: hypothetical protein E3J79_02455 [Candidatus Dependentiae bacterium]